MMKITYLFPIRKKTMLFASFGGRNFDDSPRAIYDEICNRREFDDWKLIWAFVAPERFTLPRGEKVKIDSFRFFRTLFTARVWVSNSGMDRGFELRNPRILRVETWHGTPLKKICGEEHTNAIKKNRYVSAPDKTAIRCAQSEYDREILARVLVAEKDTFLLCDLPRNDALLRYTPKDKAAIRSTLGIPQGKKVLLYVPTYREYLLNEKKETYLAPPIDLKKWEKRLGGEYVLLIRAHYAVNAALALTENDFVRDVSAYERLNDLYAVADVLLSDYSSAFIDASILGMPMLCFAYDLEEYEEKRGLYLDLAENLPCPICKTEDEVLDEIAHLDMAEASAQTEGFRRRFAPYAGHATDTVVDEMQRRLKL
ncbi:MAG: CDP-glycerol glycerophosphotransferase family protein [Firmicutes bacterium]|nr:CDP-glycerol glycerophosphotransferase family protein [Bacillota bacterium]